MNINLVKIIKKDRVEGNELYIFNGDMEKLFSRSDIEGYLEKIKSFKCIEQNKGVKNLIIEILENINYEEEYDNNAFVINIPTGFLGFPEYEDITNDDKIKMIYVLTFATLYLNELDLIESSFIDEDLLKFEIISFESKKSILAFIPENELIQYKESALKNNNIVYYTGDGDLEEASTEVIQYYKESSDNDSDDNDYFDGTGILN